MFTHSFLRFLSFLPLFLFFYGRAGQWLREDGDDIRGASLSLSLSLSLSVSHAHSHIVFLSCSIFSFLRTFVRTAVCQTSGWLWAIILDGMTSLKPLREPRERERQREREERERWRERDWESFFKWRCTWVVQACKNRLFSATAEIPSSYFHLQKSTRVNNWIVECKKSMLVCTQIKMQPNF